MQVSLHHYTQADLDSYMVNDYIGKWLAVNTDKREKELGCNKWLSDSPIKRLIFQDIYGSLLGEKEKNILDIGGGVTAFTKALGKSHFYTLVDILSHDNKAISESIFREYNVNFLNEDWFNITFTNPFDCVICNDLFPNVDQRIKIFLQKFLPLSKTILILLTYHHNDHFYKVKRTDADEVMFLQAYSWPQIRQILELIFPEFGQKALQDPSDHRPSLYANGRQVTLLKIDQSF